FLEFLLVFWIVGAVSNSGDVVRQRIQPHVDHVLFVTRNRNAPRDAGAADREILEAAAHKADHLAPRLLWRYEAGIFFVELEQFALKSRELEEIVLLAHRLGHAAAVGAWCAGRHIDPGLIRDAVLAGVRALVDKSSVPQSRKELLHAALVPLFGGADEVVVSEAQLVPQTAKLSGYPGRELLWRTAGLLG